MNNDYPQSRDQQSYELGVVAGVGGVGVAAGAAGGEGGFCAEEGGIIVVGLRAGWDGEGVVREAVEA